MCHYTVLLYGYQLKPLFYPLLLRFFCSFHFILFCSALFEFYQRYVCASAFTTYESPSLNEILAFTDLPQQANAFAQIYINSLPTTLYVAVSGTWNEGVCTSYKNEAACSAIFSSKGLPNCSMTTTRGFQLFADAAQTFSSLSLNVYTLKIPTTPADMPETAATPHVVECPAPLVLPEHPMDPNTQIISPSPCAIPCR